MCIDNTLEVINRYVIDGEIKKEDLERIEVRIAFHILINNGTDKVKLNDKGKLICLQ